MIIVKYYLLFTGLILHFTLNGQEIPADAIRASGQIQPNTIRAHMRFLADDLLEGRKPFTRGYQLAAHYVASEFEEMGLIPGVGDTSYDQHVELFKNKSTIDGILKIHDREGSQSLVPGKDFLLISEPEQMDPYEREIVFGGIGVQDPSLGYHDMENLDVKNKFVILYYWHPDDRSIQLSLKHMHDQRMLRLKAAGAAGVILYIPRKDQERLSWERFKYYFNREIYKSTYLDFPVLLIDWKVINSLFSSIEPSLEAYTNEGKLPSQYKIKATLKPTLQLKKHFDIAKSSNVLGYLQGSDPRLKEEYIIYTAHLDHEGIGPSDTR